MMLSSKSAASRLGRFVLNRRRSLSASTTSPTSSPWILPNRDDTVLLGCVSYDPAVGDIWSGMKAHLRAAGVPGFDFVLFTNYEQQVRALLDGHVDVAWNGPVAHVLAEQHDDIVSLGMRDVDGDFESIVVVTQNSGITATADLNGARLVSGAQDSPQAHVVPKHYLQNVQNINVDVTPINEDLGKHGDTALGEIRALEFLANDSTTTPQYQGALLSRMMYDRAMAGQLPTVDAAKLRAKTQVLSDDPIPRFDHCQFDALESTVTANNNNNHKLDNFYTALHAMDYNDPVQQPVMKLEGIRQSWAKPRQGGYDIVRAAMGVAAGRRAQNYVPPQTRSFGTTTTTTTTLRHHGQRSFSSSSSNIPKLPPASRVGVIGCGVTGLQVIRSMRARGYDVTAFDKAPNVGGLWRDNYANFGLQVPKQFYELPDLDMTEAAWGELASGPQVQAYIERFASEFDLGGHVKLNTGIESVSSNPDGTWTFYTDAGDKHTFDYCVVSTGMYSTSPFVPQVDGKETFSGCTIHSSQFKDADTTANKKRVLIVGGGKSATDCATSAANAGAESVTLIQRRAHWPTPLHIAGLIPFQHVFLSRLGQALVEAKVGVYPGSQSRASLFRPIMGAVFAIVEELFAFQLRLKGDLRPKSGVVEDFYGFAAVQDNSFKSVRDAGKVDVKLGEIESFTQDGVRLVNGQEIVADVVIFATGFEKDYGKLFEPHVLKHLDIQKDGMYLFKRILPPSVEGLAFVGSETAAVFNSTAYGLQAEWLARTLAGETHVDLNEKAMAREANAFRDFARSWMPATGSRSALVLLHQLHYYDQLLADMGENPLRKSNPVAEYLGSYYSGDYNGIVGRPSHLAAAATAA